MRGRLSRRLRASASAVATVAANRQLRRALSSYAAAWTAELALTVAIGVVAFRDGGPTTVAVVAFLRMVPAALIAPAGAVLADRVRRERVLRWTCIARAALLTGAAIILAVDGPLVLVYGATIAASGVFAAYRPVHSALLPHVCTTPLELTSAYVARGFITSVATVTGPIVAAVLLGLANAASAVIVVAALAWWSAWCLVGLSYETTARRAARPSGDLIAGFRALATYPGARLLAALASTQTFTRGCLNVLVLVIAIDLLDGSDADVGILSAAVGVGAIAGTIVVVAMRARHGLAALLGIGVAMWALPLVVVGAAPHVLVVLAMFAVIGIGDSLVDVGLFTLPSRLVPDHVLARWFGALESVLALAVAIGALVVAPLIAVLDARWTLAVVGSIGPAAVLVSWRRLHRIDASVAVRDDVIASLQRVAMLRPLPMPAIEALAAGAERASLTAGEVVFSQGDQGDRFYVIDSGEAIVRRDRGVSITLGPGDCFGEIALLRDVPRTATVAAESDLELRSIDRQHFLTTVTGYASSASSASALADDRLAADGRQ